MRRVRLSVEPNGKQSRILGLLLTLLASPGLAAGQLPAAEAFNRAVELQRQGDWAAAVPAWFAFLKLEPNHAGAHANLGTALSRLNRYEEAIASFETALRLNPGLTPLLYNLSFAHVRAGQHARAVESLDTYLKSNPNFLPARRLLGLALVELGRDAEAVVQLESAMAADRPDAPGAEDAADAATLYALGLAYVRLRRAELERVISRLAALPGGAALSQLLAGQVHLREADDRRAVETFEAARRLDPALPRLHFSLGVAYLRSERRADAVRAFEQELRRQPRDFWTLYYLAYLDEADGRMDAARERLRAALDVDARSVEANALLGKIRLRQGQAAAAVAPLELAVAGNPADSNTRFLLARAYQQSGRARDAAREFAEVRRLKNLGIEAERSKLSKPD
jgi:tetratricopeptide (TPR) repeat protein